MNRRGFLASLAAVFAWRRPAPKPEPVCAWCKGTGRREYFDPVRCYSVIGPCDACRTFLGPRYYSTPPAPGDGSLRIGETIRVKTPMRFVPYEIPRRWHTEELWTMTPRGLVSSTGSARRAAAAASTPRSPAL